MTLGALFDLIEREALRPGQGRSASHLARVAVVQSWLGDVIACPVEWRERVAAVPVAQGSAYALALADAATGKRIPRNVKPVSPCRNPPAPREPVAVPPAARTVSIDPFTGVPINKQEWIL